MQLYNILKIKIYNDIVEVKWVLHLWSLKVVKNKIRGWLIQLSYIERSKWWCNRSSTGGSSGLWLWHAVRRYHFQDFILDFLEKIGFIFEVWKWQLSLMLNLTRHCKNQTFSTRHLVFLSWSKYAQNTTKRFYFQNSMIRKRNSLQKNVRDTSVFPSKCPSCNCNSCTVTNLSVSHTEWIFASYFDRAGLRIDE